MDKKANFKKLFGLWKVVLSQTERAFNSKGFQFQLKGIREDHGKQKRIISSKLILKKVASFLESWQPS